MSRPIIAILPSMHPRERHLIALDIDGTLLDPLGRLTPRTTKAVGQVKQAGHVVAIATGRNWTEARAVLAPLAHDGPGIFAGGALVVDTGSGQTLFRRAMHPDLARALTAELEAAGEVVLALQETAAAGVDYYVTAGRPLPGHLLQWLDLNVARVEFTPDLATAPHANTLRIGIVCDPADAGQARTLLSRVFGERIYLHSIEVPRHGVEVLEIFDPQVNKWTGIVEVCRQLKLDPTQTIAVGDDVNDLQMLRGAGLGVAMGNAAPHVRAAAAHVIGANSDDGLAVFLEHLAAGGIPAALAA